MQQIEAVPNVSEGKNRPVLRTLENTLCHMPGVQLLGTDSNPSANRTVFTIAGEPSAVCTALFHFISQAAQLIDMRRHHGVHSRLGAVDVCPLIPLQQISLAETARYAQQLAKCVGEKLNIPVYLYEAAATRAVCKNLADIRRGEYESLAEKLRTLPPDFGPAVFSETVQKTGASIIGARHFLIAFNINLNTQDITPAKQIAVRIREKNGGLPGVKAIGWYMETFKRAQVSCNITDFHQAPLSLVFETVRREAQALGVQATGCELVGLVPLEAILETGKHYAPTATHQEELVHAAAYGLNLSDVKPFIPEQQILQWCLKTH